MNRRKIIAATAALPIALGLSGCSNIDNKMRTREAQQTATNKSVAQTSDTLEQKNLRRRLAIEEKADQVGYVYLLSFAKPIGYYTIKGKVSSSGSQLAPEEDIVTDRGSGGGGNVVVDSAQDDGTYGSGDPGIFFFTSDGAFVHTSLDYVYSTEPLPLNVPELSNP